MPCMNLSQGVQIFISCNVQSDDLWPSRMHTATHILQKKTHACGVLKRHYIRVHVSLGSAETLVRRGGIINHNSIAYSLSTVRLSVCDVAVRWSYRLSYFESNYIAMIISLGSSLLGTLTSVIVEGK